MERIITVNLTCGTIECEEYKYTSTMEYGRGLARRLLERNVPLDAERYSPENAIVIVPGILTGSHCPSACRMHVVSKKDRTRGMQVCNTTGDFPQKLASCGIAALVVKGADVQGDVVILIDKEDIHILHMPEAGKATSVKAMISLLRDAFGKDAALFGVSKAGDMRMSLATFFCTYPDGSPEFHCPRSGFGDIPGSKGLRAIVVKQGRYFRRHTDDEEGLIRDGRKLTSMIVNNSVCGNALPGFGSATIMKILKSGKDIVPVEQENRRTHKGEGKINYCCAPMCVVGCLNRHSQRGGEQFESPDQSEVLDALERCLGTCTMAMAKEVQERANNLGIVGTEFVTAASVYLKATRQKESYEILLQLMDEIEKGTVIGRLVASRTTGIYSIYQDRSDLTGLLDRLPIADESGYDIIIKQYKEEFPNLSGTELLYVQIFVLENLGICLFTSFATLNSKQAMELMAQMFTERTGNRVTDLDLLRYAQECIVAEREMEYICSTSEVKTNIPPFTKVLYRYFGKQK